MRRNSCVPLVKLVYDSLPEFWQPIIFIAFIVTPPVIRVQGKVLCLLALFPRIQRLGILLLLSNKLASLVSKFLGQMVCVSVNGVKERLVMGV